MAKLIYEGSGSRIRAAREERGISPSELARLVDVTPAAVWNWENNNVKPRSEALESTARILGVTSSYLMTGKKAPSHNESPAETVASILESARQKLARASGMPLEKVKLVLQFADE